MTQDSVGVLHVLAIIGVHLIVVSLASRTSADRSLTSGPPLHPQDAILIGAGSSKVHEANGSTSSSQFAIVVGRKVTLHTPLDSQHAAPLATVSSTRRQAEVRKSSDQFAIVVLPDTQYYSRYPFLARIFSEQTHWIKDQVENKGNPRNIVFVSHLGDIVDSDMIDQWTRANTAMSVLGRPGGPFVLPHGVLPGNHDFFETSVKETGADNHVSRFGPQRFAGASWYGGADPSGLNSYQFFSGGRFEFLHVSLEWQPDRNIPERDPSPLEWASKVLRTHPNIPTIVSTHEYIGDDIQGRTRHGDEIFNTFVKKYDQVFMVLCGHAHAISPSLDGGKWHQVSMNDLNHPVIEVLQDFQDYPNGGNGWLRIITFDPAAGQLHFETYSPWLDMYQPDSFKRHGPRTGKFTIPLDFAGRLTQPVTAS